MHEPEEEEGEHALGSNPDGERNVVRDVGEAVAKNAAQNVGHEGCTGVDCVG